MDHVADSRRRWMQQVGGIGMGGGWARDWAAAPDTPPNGPRNWTWKQLTPRCARRIDLAVPRDPWNGMLAHERSLYRFGGAFPRYGAPRGPADLTTLGVLNDCWCFDPADRQWSLLEPHDGRLLERPIQLTSRRPTTLAAIGTALLGNRIFLFGGWSGDQRGVILSDQRWSFDVRAPGHCTDGEPRSMHRRGRPNGIVRRSPRLPGSSTCGAVGTPKHPHPSPTTTCGAEILTPDSTTDDNHSIRLCRPDSQRYSSLRRNSRSRLGPPAPNTGTSHDTSDAKS